MISFDYKNYLILKDYPNYDTGSLKRRRKAKKAESNTNYYNIHN